MHPGVRPRGLICHMCKQEYFLASLKFHVKACAKKQEHVELPCGLCNGRFHCTELKMHMKYCRNIRQSASRWQHSAGDRAGSDQLVSAGDSESNQPRLPVRPPGKGEKLAVDAPLRPHTSAPPQHVQAAGPRLGLSCDGGNRSRDTTGDGSHLDGEKETVAAIYGRVACCNCHRLFSSDRVGVHENICKRVNAPSTHDGVTGMRKKYYRAGENAGRSAYPSVQPSRRRSSCPVFGEVPSAASAREWRRRSMCRFKACSTRGRHAIDDSDGGEMSLGANDKVWRRSDVRKVQDKDTAATPKVSPGPPPASGVDIQGQPHSSHGHERCWFSPPAEEQRKQSRGTKHCRAIGGGRRNEGDPNGAPGGASAEQHWRPRTSPGSAGWSPYLKTAGRRLPTGRVVSMSCSPIRPKSSSTSPAMRPASDAGFAQRREVDGFDVRGFGESGDSCSGWSNAAFGRQLKVYGLGGAGTALRSERLPGGIGFFSPPKGRRRIEFFK